MINEHTISVILASLIDQLAWSKDQLKLEENPETARFPGNNDKAIQLCWSEIKGFEHCLRLFIDKLPYPYGRHAKQVFNDMFPISC